MAESVIITLIQFVASYAGIIIFGFFAANWLSKGWFYSFIRSKASKGKKLIIEVISKTDTYYTVGGFDKDGAFKYKTRYGKKKSFVDVPDGAIRPISGVFGVTIDEKKDTFWLWQTSMYSEVSAEQTDAFLNRIAQARELDDKKEMIMLILLGVVILAQVVTLWMIFNLASTLTEIQQISGII